MYIFATDIPRQTMLMVFNQLTYCTADILLVYTGVIRNCPPLKYASLSILLNGGNGIPYRGGGGEWDPILGEGGGEIGSRIGGGGGEAVNH